ncbi:hypothetical protein WMY93_028420 [Mugilogobius chulae]|uniref:Neurobeachin n=1 Tax=Mugilogobius chulae TaxID=88201 RepID=A0AAW0MSR9_9GOBI
MVSVVHVYIRWRNSEVRCYVNGQLVSYGDMAWHVNTNHTFDKCFLGSSEMADASRVFCGQMGAVYVFSDALNPAQIFAIHQLGPSYKSTFKFKSESDVHLAEHHKQVLYDGKLSSSIGFMYNAQATDAQLCLESSPRENDSVFVHSPHGLMLQDVTATVTRSIHSSLHSIGGIQVLIPLFTQLDCLCQTTALRTTQCDLTRTCLSLTWDLTNLLFVCLLQSSHVHLSRAVLDQFLSFAKYLDTFPHGAPLLKQLCDHVLFNAALWIHSPVQVQQALYTYLSSEFLSTSSITSSAIRRLGTVLQLMHALKYYYWACDPTLTSSLTAKGLDGPRPSPKEVLCLRASMLLFLKQLLLKEQGVKEEELQCILNYLLTMQEDDNLLDVLQLLVALMSEHPASVVPAFDHRHGIRVVHKLLASQSESVRVHSLKTLGYFLKHLGHKRKAELEQNHSLLTLLGDKLRGHSCTVSMSTYNALYEILTEQMCTQVIRKPHAEPDSAVKIQNPMILKVVATLLKNAEPNPELMEVKRLFLSDLIKLFSSSRENRRCLLQCSVWQDWMFSLGFIHPRTSEEQEMMEMVHSVFRILLYHAIKHEWGGWRVWVDTLAIAHSKVTYEAHKTYLDKDKDGRTHERIRPTNTFSRFSNQSSNINCISVNRSGFLTNGKPNLQTIPEAGVQELLVDLKDDTVKTNIFDLPARNDVGIDSFLDKTRRQDHVTNSFIFNSLDDKILTPSKAPVPSFGDVEPVGLLGSILARSPPGSSPSVPGKDDSDLQATPGDSEGNEKNKPGSDCASGRRERCEDGEEEEAMKGKGGWAGGEREKEEKRMTEGLQQSRHDHQPRTSENIGLRVTELKCEFSPGPHTTMFRIPEFQWSHLHLRLLSDLLSALEGDVCAWRSDSSKPLMEFVNSRENLIFVHNTVHVVCQLVDNLIMSCGGILPLLSAATSAAAPEQQNVEPPQGLSPDSALSLLSRLMVLVDVLVFSTSLNFSEMEAEKNMSTGGLLRQCLRLVCCVAVKTCLAHSPQLQTKPSSSNQGTSPKSNCSKDDSKQSQFLALAVVYFISVLMVSKYRDILEPRQETDRSSSQSGPSRQEVKCPIDSECESRRELPGSSHPAHSESLDPGISSEEQRPGLLLNGTDPSHSSTSPSGRGLSVKDILRSLVAPPVDRAQTGHEPLLSCTEHTLKAQIAAVWPMHLHSFDRSVVVKTVHSGTSGTDSSASGPSAGGPANLFCGPSVSHTPKSIINTTGASVSASSSSSLMNGAVSQKLPCVQTVENSVDNTSLSTKLERALEKVAPLLREIFVDFAPFLSRTLLGSHGQELLIEGLVCLKSSTSVVELVMLLCSQEWQNSIQKNAGLAFIELINEGRLLCHAMKDHIVRVANEAEFILNKQRAQDAHKHAEFESSCSVYIAEKTEEETLSHHLLSAAQHRHHVTANQLAQKTLHSLTNQHGAWGTPPNRHMQDFWRLDYWEDDLRRRRRFIRNPLGSTYSDIRCRTLQEDAPEKDEVVRLSKIQRSQPAVHSPGPELELPVGEEEDDSGLLQDRDVDSLGGPVLLSSPAQLVAPVLVTKGTVHITATEICFEAEEDDPVFRAADAKVRHDTHNPDHEPGPCIYSTNVHARQCNVSYVDWVKGARSN